MMDWWIDVIKFGVAVAIIVTAFLMMFMPVSWTIFFSSAIGVITYRVSAHFLTKKLRKHRG